VKIVIPDDYQDIADKVAAYSLIRQHEVTRYTDSNHDLDTLVSRLGDADVVVSIRERVPLTRALLERLPKLRLISLLGRTAATIDFAACTELGIPITTGVSNSPDSPSEHTLALILSSRRNITREAEGMKRGALPSTVAYRLRGSTLGILGLGAIGELVAQGGKGLGMNVLVWGRGTSRAKARDLGFAVAASSAELFERSDILSLHARLTKDTRGMVGPADLARMKPTALLVNTSRAPLIAEGALAAALEKGRPGFAAVDVYEDEPVVGAAHPLLKMKNALCSPHLGYAEAESYEALAAIAVDQLLAYADGKPINVANPEALAKK